jgi:tRNA threonylcarbamoyladenosine biosynthesis protein TsaB
MLTLSLDTSTEKGVTAVSSGTQILSSRTWLREKSHSELVTSTMQECMLEAGLEFKDLERLVVGQGPGSFTGIRIAINAVKTLAYTLKIPTFAYDTCEIIAAQIEQSGAVLPDPVLVLLNAHKNLLYTARFEFQDGFFQRTSATAALSLEEIAVLVQDQPHLCLGDGYLEWQNHLPAGLSALLLRSDEWSDFPRPEVLGQLPERPWPKVSPLDWNSIQALYIRASGAEEKLWSGLLKTTPKTT